MLSPASNTNRETRAETQLSEAASWTVVERNA